MSKHDEKCAKKFDELDLNLALYEGKVAINNLTTMKGYNTGYSTGYSTGYNTGYSTGYGKKNHGKKNLDTMAEVAITNYDMTAGTFNLEFITVGNGEVGFEVDCEFVNNSSHANSGYGYGGYGYGGYGGKFGKFGYGYGKYGGSGYGKYGGSGYGYHDGGYGHSDGGVKHPLTAMCTGMQFGCDQEAKVKFFDFDKTCFPKELTLQYTADGCTLSDDNIKIHGDFWFSSILNPTSTSSSTFAPP